MSETVYTVVPDGLDAFRVQAQAGETITLSRQRFLDEHEARVWIAMVQRLAAKGRRQPTPQPRTASASSVPRFDDPFLL